MNRVFFYHPIVKPSLELMLAEIEAQQKERWMRIKKTAVEKARRHKLPIPQDKADILNLLELLQWRKEKQNATM